MNRWNKYQRSELLITLGTGSPFPSRVHSAKSETALADGKGQTISQASMPLMKMQSTHSEPNSTAGIGKGELGLLFGVQLHQTTGGFFY